MAHQMNKPPESLIQRHAFESDIFIAGGGPAGVACAIAAARQGVKVILAQDRPVLGGNASSEIRMHVVGANSGRPCQDLVLEARESGIIEEIRLENAVRNPQRSPTMFDIILYEKCRAEKNLTVFLNTRVTGAKVENNCIQEAYAERHSTEDEFVFRSPVFVDCTGDGGLGAAAGAAYMTGREAADAFGESLALKVADGKTLGSTLLFMARKHDRVMPFVPPPWARRFSAEDLRLRKHEIHHGLEYGYWWIEWGGQLDTIKDNEVIRDELLAIVMGIWDHVKNGGAYGADCWALDWIGAVPGKRESRRFIGKHILTEKDIMESRAFPDAIAYGGWPIDLHPPEGIDRPDEKPCTQVRVPFLYDIPLRACLSRDISNLMFAGRNISATHVGFASTRVMATCAVVGEGVGVAAALAVQRKRTPADLDGDSAAWREIRQRLSREDVYLIGEKYAWESDLALSASIRASSQKSNGAPCNVTSGQNRTVSGERGLPPEREDPGTHRWMSDELPAWIELRWNRPVDAEEVELVFDTGLHRYLTLTQSDAYLSSMRWGCGQPETVKHYRLEVETEAGWQLTEEVKDNWQRRRIHRLDDVAGKYQAVRVFVLSAWDIDHARIMQIRVLPAHRS